MLRVIIGLIAALSLCSCVTNYNEPSGNKPRAILKGKQTNCIFGCNGGVFVEAVNGLPVSYAWKSNGFYVDAGQADVLVSVRDSRLYGLCDLKMNVVDGEEYEIGHVLEGSQFVVTAYDKSGEAVSTCNANMGPAPAAPSYVPIIIPTG